MEIIIHRINTIKQLKSISNNFGTEIDIRSSSSKLILSHDPFVKGDSLENYLYEYKKKGTLVLNIKENPIIENISISGIKKKEFKENLLEKISLKNRSSFINYKLENDLNLINNILKQSGYYFSDVETIINKNDENKAGVLLFRNSLKRANLIKSAVWNDLAEPNASIFINF